MRRLLVALGLGLLSTSSVADVTVANHALMLGIADGTIPYSQVVDEHAGVVAIDNSGDARGDGHRDAPALRCGASLHALFDHWKARLADRTIGLRATYSENRLTCRNTPAPACIWRGMGEWDPTVHFLFRQTPHGLVLRAIDQEDEILVLDEQVAKNRARIIPTVQRLEAGGCP